MFDKLKDMSLSIILSVLIIIAILNSFTNNIYFYILPIFFITVGVFFLCHFLFEKGVLGFCAYALILAGLLVFAKLSIMKISLDMMQFYEWVLVGNSDKDLKEYFNAIFPLTIFLIPTVIFYFTFKIYRPYYLFFVMLFPFLLGSKKSEPISVFFYAIIISVYIILLIHLESIHSNKESNIIKNSKVLATNIFYSILFIIFVFLVSNIKYPESFSKYNYLSKISSADFLGFSSKSSSNLKDADLKKILFYIEADESLYYIRQIFGNYDGEKWNAPTDTKLISSYSDLLEKSENINFNNLLDIIKSSQISKSEKKFSGLENINTNIDVKKTSKIYTETNSQFILAPIRTFKVFTSNNKNKVVKNSLGELYIQNSFIKSNDEYIVDYYSKDFFDNEDLKNIATSFSIKEYEMLLKNLTADEALMNNSSSSETLNDFLLDYAIADYFDRSVEVYNDEKINELAKQIIKGKKTDFDKAKAIEEYFHNGGYKYDIKFFPPKGKESIEYFIFESKTGTCTDYATAMTLMARSVGLNARYVEGFISNEINEEGKFVVRTKNSHAFTQVYLPFYGWTNFDATVPSYFVEEITDDTNTSDKISSNNLAKYTLIAICVITFLVLSYKFFLKELLFKIFLNLHSNNKTVLLVYVKILEIIEEKLNLKNISPKDLKDIILRKYNLDLSKLISFYERIEFNEESISRFEKKESIKIYINFKKIIK